MTFFFQFFLLKGFVSLQGNGFCRCPIDYFPVPDSVKATALNALESFTHVGPYGPDALIVPDILALKPRYNAERALDTPVNSRSAIPRVDFKLTCLCENSCGEKLEVPFQADLAESSYTTVERPVI